MTKLITQVPGSCFHCRRVSQQQLVHRHLGNHQRYKENSLPIQNYRSSILPRHSLLNDECSDSLWTRCHVSFCINHLVKQDALSLTSVRKKGRGQKQAFF